MSVICVDKNVIYVCIDYEIWWKDFTQNKFNKFLIQPNLNNNTVNKACIKQAVLSKDGSLLAVLFSNKLVFLFKLPEVSHFKTFELQRAGSKLAFSNDSQLLLVADKTGDVFQFEINLDLNKGSQILGHLSLLTDILMSHDDKYVLTSDRDEKIRVSNFPKTYDIQSFCLGHKEFVISMKLLPHNENYLVSTSGDGCVKIWDYIIGKELYSLDINNYVKDKSLIRNFQKTMKDIDIDTNCLPISLMSCCKKEESSSLIAISLHSLPCIFVFEISSTNDLLVFNLFDEVHCSDSMYDAKLTSGSLWVLYLNGSLKLEQWCQKVDKYALTASEVLKEHDGAESSFIDKNEIKLLYKRKFDNVQEYKIKKKQRLGID